VRYVEQAADNKWLIKEDPLSYWLAKCHSWTAVLWRSSRWRERNNWCYCIWPSRGNGSNDWSISRKFSRIVTAMQQAGLELDNRLCRLRLRWSICNVQWTRRRCSIGQEQSPSKQTIFIVRCIPLICRRHSHRKLSKSATVLTASRKQYHSSDFLPSVRYVWRTSLSKEVQILKE